MKKPSGVPVREQELEALKQRVASLERTTAALSARMLSLFGAAAKDVDAPAPGALRPAVSPAGR